MCIPVVVALYLQCPTWNVNARLALVHLVHVLDPGQLGPKLLAARLALPVAGLGLVGCGGLLGEDDQNYQIDQNYTYNLATVITIVPN